MRRVRSRLFCSCAFGIGLRAAGLRAALVVLAVAPALAGGASAQTLEALRGGGERFGPVFTCRLPVHDAAPPAGAAIRWGAWPAPGRTPHAHVVRSATFEVTYRGFPAEAQAAFQRAVDVWATHVTSPVPIRVEATWEPLGTNILGTAGPFLLRDFAGAPAAGTWYPAALADALAGRNLDDDPTAFDVEARFNSDFGRWHFGPEPPPAGRFDLSTVVLHELAHGRGFIGAFKVEGGLGRLGVESAPGVPFIYDRFSEDASGRALLDYPEPSVPLAQALQDPEVPAARWTDAVFFDGPTTRATNRDERAALYAPTVWSEGSSYSHFDEATYPLGTPFALMTPFIGSGELVGRPDALVCAALADMGWTPGAGCAEQIVGGPPPPGEVYTLAVAQNPFPDRTTLRLTVATGQRVRALLFNAAGRRVAELFDGFLAEGDEATLPVQGALASGVYFVRVVGESFEAVQAVTRLR